VSDGKPGTLWSPLHIVGLLTANVPESNFTIAMLSEALIEDHPDLASSSKVSKVNVGVGVVIRRLAFGQSLMMAF
jgi:hypothetical protein